MVQPRSPLAGSPSVQLPVAISTVGISRRVFIKRTTATALVAVMAIDAYSDDPPGSSGSGSSVPRHYILKLENVSDTCKPVEKTGDPAVGETVDFLRYRQQDDVLEESGSGLKEDRVLTDPNTPSSHTVVVPLAGGQTASVGAFALVPQAIVHCPEGTQYPNKTISQFEPKDFYQLSFTFPFEGKLRMNSVALNDPMQRETTDCQFDASSTVAIDAKSGVVTNTLGSSGQVAFGWLLAGSTDVVTPDPDPLVQPHVDTYNVYVPYRVFRYSTVGGWKLQIALYTTQLVKPSDPQPGANTPIPILLVPINFLFLSATPFSCVPYPYGW